MYGTDEDGNLLVDFPRVHYGTPNHYGAEIQPAIADAMAKAECNTPPMIVGRAIPCASPHPNYSWEPPLHDLPGTIHPVIKTDNGGLRYNEGKAPIHLIPPEVITALANHFKRGAEKYQPRNWERGMDWSKCYDSLTRHVLAWQSGEDNDPETGTHHMVAAMWNAAALYWYSLKKVGKDDRPKYEAN